MAIKIDGKDLQKRIINGQEVEKVMLNGGQIRPETVPPVGGDYLCFTAQESNSTLTLNYGYSTTPMSPLEISYDKVSWGDYRYGTTLTLSNVGDKIYWRNKSETPEDFSDDAHPSTFSMSGKIGASGDITYLLCKYGTTTFPSHSYGSFSQLFSGCTALTSAPRLPITTLAQYCYRGMFSGCTSLTTAPELPSTSLSNGCYWGMFDGCTSLVNAPVLPATTLTQYCYAAMFQRCTSLVNAPALPATTSPERCYSNMFYGCTALRVAPELPATTLRFGCYSGMFYGCTALVTPPELPATTLPNSYTYKSGCYQDMFYGCTSLVTLPELPATTLGTDCYNAMFGGCTSLSSLPELPATTLKNNCYSNMFRGCTSIKLSDTQGGEYQTPYTIPSSGTGTDASSTMSDMFYNTGGTFTGTPSINTTYYTSNQVI